MHIHREGYRIIALSFFMLLALNIGLGFILLNPFHSIMIAGISLLLLLMIIRFFRVPARNASLDDLNILSPADGKVIAIQEINETEYFHDQRIQISIFMSVWDVHVNWYPVSGTITYFKYHPGQYLIAKHPKSSLKNERMSMVINKNTEQHIMVRQIAGAVARRIVCHAIPESSVNQADEMGIIKFGSRLDVILPLNAELKVKPTEKVKGQQSILARWPE